MAMVILSIGVLGTFALVDGANQRTSDNKGREGATSLARDLVESSRTVPFNNITQADLEAALSTREGLGDADGGAGWQIERRNFTYTVNYSICTVDDVSDRLGSAASHDATFCPGTQAAGAAAGVDRNPVDFMRIVFTIAWEDTGGERQLRQAALVNSTYRGPAIRTLNTPGTVTSGTDVNFDVALTTTASSVKWFVDGHLHGDASGSGTAWSWIWDLGAATCPTPSGAVQDGTYFVSAAGYDRNGSTGGPKAVSVNVNRCAPSAPTGVVGGRNWGGVEISWEPNPESDVVGYEVFRDGDLVCSTASAADTSCRDNGTTGAGSHVYTVVAYDTGATGRRAGEESAELTVLPDCGSSPCNTAPNAPEATKSGDTITIVAPSPEDADSGDSISFYRIYRTSGATPPTGAEARYDSIDNSAASVAWTDAQPGGYRYWITAVDEHYSESDFAEVAP